MDAQMMEMQGLSVFGTFSIAFALRSIGSILARSEERRGGKECRSRWSPYH